LRPLRPVLKRKTRFTQVRNERVVKNIYCLCAVEVCRMIFFGGFFFDDAKCEVMTTRNKLKIKISILIKIIETNVYTKVTTRMDLIFDVVLLLMYLKVM
jgi:hypothetical protein